MNIIWDEQAITWATYWGLTLDDVEAVVRKPQRSAYDPRSAEMGYRILRHRSGDVIVVVGYRNPAEPKILYVITETGIKERAGTSKGIKGGSKHTGAPRSDLEIRRMILSLGYKINGGTNPVVLTQDGRSLMRLFYTTSTRSLAVQWQRFCKKHAGELLRERESRNGNHDQTEEV